MILSDQEISHALYWDEITIDPVNAHHIQPASYDVTLGPWFGVERSTAIYPTQYEPHWDYTKVDDGTSWLLRPGEFVLGATLERIRLPNNIAARLEGKSSLGRMGLMVHVSAGFIDPGFDGTLTLEIVNVSRNVLLLEPYMRIGQVAFYRTGQPSVHPYGHAANHNHYQSQTLPEAAFSVLTNKPTILPEAS